MQVVEEETETDSTEGVEIFFLTKNAVAEAVYYWENSSDKDIFELMLLLVYLELRGCFILQIIWVAGTRQIAAGIDDCLRGHLTDGIASSGSILDFVPLNEKVFQRLTTMLPWVQKWIGVNNIETLTPEGWFEEVHIMNEGKKNGNDILISYN